MKLPTTLRELTEMFRRVGARDPELWAKSQLDEGIPQLQRFLFLRQAWAAIPVGDSGWIDKAISYAEKNPSGPYADIGRVLKLCIERGVSADDLTAFMRAAKAQALFAFCYLLDDPKLTEPELHGFSWGLFQTGDNDEPIPPRIGGLHESVLELDPAGREVRPKGIRP
jgi:hypothetical protein